MVRSERTKLACVPMAYSGRGAAVIHKLLGPEWIKRERIGERETENGGRCYETPGRGCYSRWKKSQRCGTTAG